MDFELLEEQKMLQTLIRQFLRAEYPPERAKKDDDEKTFPIDLFKKMADLGWLGLPFPEKYGGSGGTVLDECLVTEELARVGTSMCFAYVLSVCFGGKSLEYSGNEEQKQYHIRKLCSGEHIYALALTEADGGTDILGSLKTSAVQDGDEFVINGSKMFITQAQLSDYLVTFARTNKNAAKKSDGFSMILVPAKSPGVQINRIDVAGVRSTGTTEIFFDDVRVPVSNLLGEKDKGWSYLTRTLNNERSIVAAGCVGITQGILDLAVQYSKDRMAFGKPIGQFQVIQHYLADISTDLDAARLMLYRTAWLLSQGNPAIVESAKTKLFATEVAARAAKVGMRIMAGAGYQMESPMQRFYRDAVLFLWAPVSNEMTKNLIGEAELGLPRSY